MPVTAKLSRAFYERLGDDVANELVEWFNPVDLTYRTELRELNDLNFARFDAKVGERLAELRGEMDSRFAASEVRLTQRLTELREELSDKIQNSKASILRWMFGFWIGTALVILGSRLAV